MVICSRQSNGGYDRDLLRPLTIAAGVLRIWRIPGVLDGVQLEAICKSPLHMFFYKVFDLLTEVSIINK
jgi:hypothetical protein